MFELVDDNIDGAMSWVFVHSFVKFGCKVERIFPGSLAVCGCSLVYIVEVVP